MVKPCVLISCAVGLVFMVGPQSSDDASMSVVADSHHGGRAATAILAHSKTLKDNNVSCAALRRKNRSAAVSCSHRQSHRASWHALLSEDEAQSGCGPCRVTEQIVRDLDAGPANPLMPLGRLNRTQLQCPGLIGALGTRMSSGSRGRTRGKGTVRSSRLGTSGVGGGSSGSGDSGGSSDSGGSGGSVDGRGWLESCGGRGSEWAERASVRGKAFQQEIASDCL